MDNHADYDPFAEVYDRHWGDFSTRVLPALDRLVLGGLGEGSLLLDLCCGTGQLAAAFNERGYRVIGLDESEAMVGYARKNAPESEFVVADACSFTLPQPVDAAVSTYDSLNHIMTLSDLVEVFRHVHAALTAGGRFLFDLNMLEGFQARWRGSFGFVSDDEVIVARPSYHPDEAIGHMDFTIMTLDGDSWQRRDLAFTQRCYSEHDVRSALTDAGFFDVEILNAHDLDVDDVGRSFFLCHKPTS